MFITQEFKLKRAVEIKAMKQMFGFDGFGEIVYYRTYSRIKEDGGQENWADTVIRVIEGIMSYRKNHYVLNRIHWDETYWQHFAFDMALSLYRLEWSPPGRGLYQCGANLVKERGAMALYNCLFVTLKKLVDPLWLMESLCYGCGVGYEATNEFEIPPFAQGENHFVIPDTKEGWVQALEQLCLCVDTTFDYAKIRLKGEPIRTFGGTASGPDPLADMLETLRILFQSFKRGRIDKETYIGLANVEDARYKRDNDETAMYQRDAYLKMTKQHEYTTIMLQNDLANLIGKCIVTGNVRRSALLSLGSLDDENFTYLKDYRTYPYREAWGWMSNNTAVFSESEHFEQMGFIADQNICGRDLGIINRCNLPLGRLRIGDDSIHDNAVGLNPCGEIPLESNESCNVCETYPTRCVDTRAWYKACEYAAFYCSTVALVPTHCVQTNRVIARNRRIGVGIVDYTGWKDIEGTNKVIRAMRKGYNIVRSVNKRLAQEAGVPASIRVTTIKPGGTVPKLAGRTSGIGHPTFDFMIRRIRVGEGSMIEGILKEANIPFEKDAYTDQTTCFEYPIAAGSSKSALYVSIWEQSLNIVTVQREWADNAVSNTLYFSEKERPEIESALSSICPMIKSLSLLPHTNQGAFTQMPEEGIDYDEYIKRKKQIKKIRWEGFRDSDGQDEKYCQGDSCIVS